MVGCLHYAQDKNIGCSSKGVCQQPSQAVEDIVSSVASLKARARSTNGEQESLRFAIVGKHTSPLHYGRRSKSHPHHYHHPCECHRKHKDFNDGVEKIHFDNVECMPHGTHYFSNVGNSGKQKTVINMFSTLNDVKCTQQHAPGSTYCSFVLWKPTTCKTVVDWHSVKHRPARVVIAQLYRYKKQQICW